MRPSCRRISSSASGTDGLHQVGTVTLPGTGGNLPGYATMWSSTPDSVVNLGPAGFYNSIAAAISDGIEVGSGVTSTSGPYALWWRGTATSAVNLNPLGYPSSIAVSTSRGQAVGWAFNGSVTHAALWTSGSANSFSDLNPSAQVSSQLTWTNGVQQVGTVTLSNGTQVAEVWNGTAASGTALPAVAPYPFTQANGIDRDGDIVGAARNAAAGGNPIPVMWVPHRTPGDANLDGKVDIADLLLMAQNYGKSGPEIGWVDGDFDMDGTVGFNDLVILARHYGPTPASSQLAQLDPAFQTDLEVAFAELPEPSSVCLLMLFTLGMLRIRQRDRDGVGSFIED